jgi:hypothetical protein
MGILFVKKFKISTISLCGDLEDGLQSPLSLTFRGN